MQAPSIRKHEGLVALTANDIKEVSEEDLRKNHDTTQRLFQDIMKHRGVQMPLASPAPFFAAGGVEEENTEDIEYRRHMFTRRIFNRLRARGIHGIRSFRVMLHHVDHDKDGTCTPFTFDGTLTHLGIRIKRSEFDFLLELWGIDEETMSYAKFFSYGYCNWSIARQEVVSEAYDCLRALCPGGRLNLSLFEAKFKPAALSGNLVPGLEQHDAAEEFLRQWSDCLLQADGVCRWLDFLDYYLDVSVCIDSEQEFCKYVCRCWGIDMDDWLAKKVFRRYASTDDENTLPTNDFLRMLEELDPSISEEEALAWYTAIDEDDSGEVSLDEFLMSKVLKVKRLFDQYDTDNSRTVDKAEMVEILRCLNPSITPDEAASIYSYADMDGNGDVSFAEFLENHLLKLLQIFEEFESSRRRELNEGEVKLLLRKLDPYLDDHEIHQVYKAIDTDGGGSISFAEFCESHVLRAKLLFDRFDTDRSRTLTQFKFRELLLDMDKSLSSQQMEAIYDLVANHNSGKVHLGGFLNPNIVKMKLLFDKYDQDGSKFLDSSEFRMMMKDMYKKASEKEIEALVHTLCPPGMDEGVTLIAYIHSFKEISRKYDAMRLARRREARRKAQAKGLVFAEQDD